MSGQSSACLSASYRRSMKFLVVCMMARLSESSVRDEAVISIQEWDRHARQLNCNGAAKRVGNGIAPVDSDTYNVFVQASCDAWQTLATVGSESRLRASISRRCRYRSGAVVVLMQATKTVLLR